MLRYSDFEDQWNGKQTVVKRNRELQNHIARIQERERHIKVRVPRVRSYYARPPRSVSECIQSATERFERVHRAAKTEWIHRQIVRWFSVRKIQRIFRKSKMQEPRGT